MLGLSSLKNTVMFKVYRTTRYVFIFIHDQEVPAGLVLCSPSRAVKEDNIIERSLAIFMIIF